MYAIIMSVISDWTQRIAGMVETEWSRYDGRTPFEKNIEALLPELVQTAIKAEIEAYGGEAWIIEYGSGSKMDADNPYLSEYKRWSGYNRHRKDDSAIRGREKGNYLDIDGNQHYSSGKAKGANLEKGLKPPYDKPYLPIEATHIIRNTVISHLGLIIDDIANAAMDYIADEIERTIPKEIRL